MGDASSSLGDLAGMWFRKTFGDPTPARERAGVRVLYVTPLKALGNDIHRNLEVPLAGMEEIAGRLGRPGPDISMGIRTGDTPQRDRERLGGVAPPARSGKQT